MSFEVALGLPTSKHPLTKSGALYDNLLQRTVHCVFPLSGPLNPVRERGVALKLIFYDYLARDVTREGL